MWYLTDSAYTDHCNFAGDTRSMSDTSRMSQTNAKRTGEEKKSLPEVERDRKPFPIKKSMAAFESDAAKSRIFQSFDMGYNFGRVLPQLYRKN